MLAVCTMDYWTMDNVGVIITYYILFMKAGCPVTFINKNFVKTKAERGQRAENKKLLEIIRPIWLDSNTNYHC